MGSLYYTATENLLAKEAYKNTLKNFQQARDESFKARFELARIYAEEENFDESLSIYEKISKEKISLEPYRSQAIEGRIKKALEKGNWELWVGEIKLALKTFLKIIDFSPKTVEAHRGYLQAASALLILWRVSSNSIHNPRCSHGLFLHQFRRCVWRLA